MQTEARKTPRPMGKESTDVAKVVEAWSAAESDERLRMFRELPRAEAEEHYFALSAADQAEVILGLPAGERRSWVRLLPPDDVADVIQAVPAEQQESLMALLDDMTRKEVTALLAYAEDDAGGLMNPRYARVRPDMSVDEAIAYLRRHAREKLETIYYVYVLDPQQKLLGVVTFRELFLAQGTQQVKDVMHTEVVAATEDLDQEGLSHLFQQHKFMSIPVVDPEGRIKGIVTMDDIVHVVQEEATEDIQKMGGTQALEAPYLHIDFLQMVRKRAGWLATLFIGEMLTATAMARFQDEIAKVVVLALFIPLIISSGGNSGSQASTLVIRAMALGEVNLGQWWRVARRELGVGVALGAILGILGMARVFVVHTWGGGYDFGGQLAWVVAFSLVGVVTFGTLAGSMLPFVLRRVGLDPASASAPFVATLVDVTGLVIYFSVAHAVLSGVVF